MPVYQYVWLRGYNRWKPNGMWPALLAISNDWPIHRMLIAHEFLSRMQH